MQNMERMFEISEDAESFMAGILKGLDAMSLFLAPSFNSSKRMKHNQKSGVY
jgi:glutamine synthetase